MLEQRGQLRSERSRGGCQSSVPAIGDRGAVSAEPFDQADKRPPLPPPPSTRRCQAVEDGSLRYCRNISDERQFDG